MPRKKTQTTGKKTDTATAIEANSQGAVTAKKASAKKKAGGQATTKKTATANRSRYGRNRALRDALATGGSRSEIVSEVDRLYAEHGGGTPNEKGARATVDIALPILREFGMIEEAEDGRLTLKQ